MFHKKSWLAAAAVCVALVSKQSELQAGVHLPVPYMAQPDNQTCLPTSFMMALNFMGRIDEFSSDTVQMLHKTCQYNRFNTPDLARKFGLYALPNWHNLGWRPETVKYELDHGRPVVLGVNQGRVGHFVLAIGYTDDNKVIIHDPSSGGYDAGGPNQVLEWKELLWRGGVILRPDPFPEAPALSGVAIGEEGLPMEWAVDHTVTSGDDAWVTYTLLNNGRVQWPEDLMLVAEDPDSSPTMAVSSPLANDWISSEEVVKVPALEPGTTASVIFKVKAPDVKQNTTFLQYFNLRDNSGNWFGTSWLAGPGNRNMAVRLIVLPKERKKWPMPLAETATAGKPDLEWGVKHDSIMVADDFTTAAPEGFRALRLVSGGQKANSCWVGDYDWKDYRVEAWVYCELRKDIARQGWQRIGLFARDNGLHKGDTKDEVEIGSSIAMTFDTDDGSIRAGYVQNGSIGDYRDKRFKLSDSGWHKFAVECRGETVTYELDGNVIHTQQKVRSYRNGDCGIYYSSAFDPALPESEKVRDVYFAGFKVTP